MSIVHTYLFIFSVEPHQRAEGGDTVLHWACKGKMIDEELLHLLFDNDGK